VASLVARAAPAREDLAMIQPLAIDLYPGDRHLDCDAFVAAGPPWCGIIAKASQGTLYRYDAWLRDLVQRFRRAAGDRYGVDLFDAFYVFLNLAEPGAPQIDYAMAGIAAAGGEAAGTLPLMLDVERGGQRNPDAISLAQVRDVTRAAAERYTALTGREATLYGGELLRSVRVLDRLGCGRSAVALYGPRLGRQFGEHAEPTADFLAATGTDLEHTMLWQYVAADGAVTTPPPGYPTIAPGIGRVDISAVVLLGGVEALQELAG
jgi:hypothetical protein